MHSSLMATLRAAYLGAFKIQSDYARENAQQVAALASMGLISTVETPGSYGRKWRVTGLGVGVLKTGGLL